MNHCNFAFSILLPLFFLLSSGGLAHAASSAADFYHALPEIAIKGQGGWDDLSLDPVAHRIYLSHADRVMVVDTKENKVVGEITGTSGVHAIALAPDLQKGFITAGKEDLVKIFDFSTLQIHGTVKVGANPDLAIYEPKRHEIYVFNGKGQSVSVIDAKSEKVVATIVLPGKPEFAAVDPESERVYVNIEDKNSLVAIDTADHKVVATWLIEGCESPTGLAFDSKEHRLFSACDNETMVMLDSNNGKKLAAVPIGKRPDGAAFDPSSGLVFSSNGEGTVTIAHLDSPTKLSVVRTLKTQAGARTLTLDYHSHRIYLPTADFAPVKGKERPKPLEGTQKLLVYGP